ncbi:MAG: MATE family efflux transporter [Clostridia bacterium]
MNQAQVEKVDLSKGSVTKLLFKLAVPAIVAQIINVLYNMVDRMYIGHIEGVGTAALTGVGVTMPVIMAISAFAALISMGGAPRAAIMLGRDDKPQAEKIMGNCLTLLVGVSVILTAVFLYFGRDILMLFGASENTIGYAWDYMKIYTMGTIFVQISLGMNAFINTQGYAKTGMLTVAIGAVCNIVLDPLFIFTFGMGVKGAALATIISQAISSVFVVRFLFSSKSYLRIRKENLPVDWKVIAPCLALGLSPFIMQFTESVISVCFNTSLATYGGDIAVGSMTILSSVMQFSMLPLQGLTQGSQPIVSFNYGAGNIARVKKGFRVLLIACLTYSTALWSIAMFAPQVFVGIFSSDAALSAYAIWAMRIYMATSLMFGAQIACQQTFIAIGNAKISVFLALLRKVLLLIPLIMILPHMVPNKVMGVFLAEPIADFLAVCTTCVLFFLSYRKLGKDSDSSHRITEV